MTIHHVLRRRRAASTLALLAGALVLTACGGGSSPTVQAPQAGAAASASYGPPASGPHNEADVAFATDMIPHHAQAVEMADIALERGVNTEVRALATAIKGAQDPEIATMSGWLVGWGKAVPSGAMSGMAGMEGMSGMQGMMSESQMQELGKASGAAFDRLWVQQMTEHHRGAIAMARTELAQGQNAEAKALAEKIIAAQQAEVERMTALMATLPTA